MVFRLEDYILHYRKPQVETFLKTLFSRFKILSVGYGLRELELLEYLIGRNSDPGDELSHHYLMPLYQGEENILEFEQAYFSRLGIQVTAYDKTEAGFSQLYHVVESWQREINRVTSSLANTFELIEQAVGQYDETTADSLFQIIKNDKAYEDQFFRLVSSPDWLIPLEERSYFDPSQNPAPVEVKDNPGFVLTPRWNVLVTCPHVPD